MTSSDVRQPPMGSDEQSAEFTEKCHDVDKLQQQQHHHQQQQQQQQQQPHFEKWKLNFQNLLDDDEGSKTFYEFLETEQLGVLFECWYSCEQYRSYPPNKATAKEVYSRYVRIKDTRVPISDQARNNLALRLRANNITEILLLEIELEVFGNLRDICYPKFLKSDFFTYYSETNGQVSYKPNEFHKFGKPVTLKRSSTLPVLHEYRSTEISNDFQTTLTPYEKETHRTPSNTKICSDIPSFSSDVFTESDRISMADSRTSGGSDYLYRSSRNCNHEQMSDLPNFRPRTQRLNQDRLRQMKPSDFAALLTEKLNKVLLAREMESKAPEYKNCHTSEHRSSHSNIQHNRPHYPYESEPSDYDSQSRYMPPSSDRYSIAGASSHSGSGANVEKNRNIKAKAKGLRDAVHHSLRNGLGECRCEVCIEHKMHCENVYGEAYSHSHYSDCKHNKDCNCINGYSNSQTNCCCHDNSHTYQNSSHYNNKYGPVQPRTHNPDGENQYDVVPPADNSKILAWMAKNEKMNQYADPQPSPALRRKKQSLIYDNTRIQPIAQDLGMPILPQPDTGNVLVEVRRVLEEPNNNRGTVKKHPSQRSHHPHINPAHYQDQNSVYSSSSYEKNGSFASGGKWSDSTSMVSYNASQISTVPSSASRYWNQHGYYESHNDGRVDQKSEARSHSTGRHSRHSNVRGSIAPSETKSHSTNRSHGSDNSKGRSNGSTVTYYLGREPIPYRINVNSHDVTLGQFKHELKRKGNYRYHFKTIDDENEVVYQEIRDDHEYLPKYKDKIVGKVETID